MSIKFHLPKHPHPALFARVRLVIICMLNNQKYGKRFIENWALIVAESYHIIRKKNLSVAMFRYGTE